MYGSMVKPLGRMSNRARRRAAEEAIQEGNKAYKVVLALLAEAGGRVQVSPRTVAMINKYYEELDYDLLEDGLVALTFQGEPIDPATDNVPRPEMPEAGDPSVAESSDGDRVVPLESDAEVGGDGQ